MTPDTLRACLARVFALPADSIPDLGFSGPPSRDPAPWELHLAEWLREQDLDLCVAAIPTPLHHWAHELVLFDHVRIAHAQDGPWAAVFNGDAPAYIPAFFPLDSYPQTYLIFLKR